MTARLRGTARVIATCTLAMLMTGCVKVDLNMQLHGDNTVSGTMVFAVSRDLLALTGSSADDLLGQITASAGPLPAGVGFQQSAYADDRFEGKTYTFQDVPIDVFSRGTTAGESIAIQRVGDTFLVNGSGSRSRFRAPYPSSPAARSAGRPSRGRPCSARRPRSGRPGARSGAALGCWCGS
ncbi:MAG: hypothetical protein E6G63_10795 [Actinobacteria bacterium]|nr:MAG: hypothetical protein E6G63_10795 [Actinomycetota bacterium]